MRRAKLFYLRERSGKSARIKERLKARESDAQFEAIPEVELSEAPAQDAAPAEAPAQDAAPAEAPAQDAAPAEAPAQDAAPAEAPAQDAAPAEDKKDA